MVSLAVHNKRADFLLNADQANPPSKFFPECSGFHAMPNLVVYAASKAYVLAFREALSEENWLLRVVSGVLARNRDV